MFLLHMKESKSLETIGVGRMCESTPCSPFLGVKLVVFPTFL